jgi:hypothetical protein
MEKFTGGCPGRLAMRSASAAAVEATPCAARQQESASTASRTAAAAIGARCASIQFDPTLIRADQQSRAEHGESDEEWGSQIANGWNGMAAD